MPASVRLGFLTPSSNTVLEPMIGAMLHPVDAVTAHFSRFSVTEISLDRRAVGQFENDKLLAAADLLADARVDAISWAGTSSGWIGLDVDRALCAALTDRTGIPATTSVLALLDAFKAAGVTRYGLVTPYLDEVQAAILETFAGAGLECMAEQHLGDRGNYSFSEYDEDTIGEMIRGVAATKPQAITVFCTNFRGARIAARLEDEIGMPVFDTVSTGLWGAMRSAGTAPGAIRQWGRLFDL